MFISVWVTLLPLYFIYLIKIKILVIQEMGRRSTTLVWKVKYIVIWMIPLEQYKAQHKIKTYVEVIIFVMMASLGGILNIRHVSVPELYPVLTQWQWDTDTTNKHICWSFIIWQLINKTILYVLVFKLLCW